MDWKRALRSYMEFVEFESCDLEDSTRMTTVEKYELAKLRDNIYAEMRQLARARWQQVP